jgi:hypothetical protein
MRRDEFWTTLTGHYQWNKYALKVNVSGFVCESEEPFNYWQRVSNASVCLSVHRETNKLEESKRSVLLYNTVVQQQQQQQYLSIVMRLHLRTTWLLV